MLSIHNHSECSNLRFSDATVKVGSLIDQAVFLNYSGICLTDHEAISGHVKFLQHYKELKEAGKLPDGFKIGLGNEIYLVDREDFYDAEGNPQRTPMYHLVVVAKDKKGHEQLRKLSSSAWTNWVRYRGSERVPTFKDDMQKIIGDDKGHLIVSTACLGGELAKLSLAYLESKSKEDKQKIVEFVTFLLETFGRGNVFFEMQPRKHLEGSETHDQVKYNRFLQELSKAFSVPFIVSTDTHYLTKDDRYVHEAFLQADPTNHGDRELGDFYEYTYMMDEAELIELLSTHLDPEIAKEAVANTQQIWEMLEEYDLEHPVIVPRDPHIPSEFELRGIFDAYPQYEYIQKFRSSEDVQERYLLKLIEDGFVEKKQEFNETNLARIDEELGTMWKVSEKLDQRIAHYYVLVRELVHKVMWPVSYVGVARGSVTGFYTCYLSGITQVNPIPHGLSAWRHLHESRPTLPDVDLDSSASQRPIIFQRMKDYYGADNALNTLAYKTLTSKSAVLAACRGLGINDDTAHTIAGYVPIERGMAWTLTECFEGNEEKERKPVTAFINAVSEHDRLKEVMLSLEGLICGRSIHASAVYVFEHGYLAQNSLFRAPNGTLTTAYNMAESDYMGGLKLDALTIKNLDMMQTCVKLLIKDGVIEDQGSLKATYDKYLHPDVLELEDPALWDLMGSNSVISLFQFDTQQGQIAAQKIKPRSVTEMASANALMRLTSGDGQETPMETYVRFKEDIGQWYKEMDEAGLSAHDQEIMKKHLASTYGVSSMQEEIMLLVMDPEIANFTMEEANVLRAGVAKKKQKVLDEVHDLFYKKGKEIGTSQALLDYVWGVQIHRQLAYSFSVNHTLPYSFIGIQELNLVYRYGAIYWNTAALTVNAGADTDNDNNDVTDYAKVATAIGAIQTRGQKVALPSINRARFDFAPDAERNEIVFSLKALRGLGDAQAECIVENQPFESFDDFLERTQDVVKASSVIALIKAGAFDELEGDREALMQRYLLTQAPVISKLTLKNARELIGCGAIQPGEYKLERTMYNYVQYVKGTEPVVKGKTAGTTWYYVRGPRNDENFFNVHVAEHLKTEKDFKVHSDGYQIVKASALERALKKITEPFKKEVLDNPRMLGRLNLARANLYMAEKCPGTLSSWEMETMSFYHGPHELANVDERNYGISDFTTLPSQPETQTVMRGKQTFEKRIMTNIAGTVIGRNKNKHMVTISTTHGVVTVKLFRDNFIYYDQQLSETNERGEKRVIEKSWFSRGNKILVHGFRRDDMFVARPEKGMMNVPTITLIEHVDEKTGVLRLKRNREDVSQIVST